MGARPPAFLSKRTLARELDMSESTVDQMVIRGVLPKPIRMSSGCVRWSWQSVERSLASLEGTDQTEEVDPFIVGARNAAKAAQASRG